MPHVADLLTREPDVPWIEVLADNWLSPSALNHHLLRAVVERYPCVLHGVGLSLGGADPIDRLYLDKVVRLKRTLGAAWYSEHCSFCSHEGWHTPDLLPLPYTDEAVRHIASRIALVQDVLGERLLLENVSSYIELDDAPMSEGEFLTAITEEADCDLLLDINNAYVSEVNHAGSAVELIEAVPLARVRQVHLAGHEDCGGFLIDAHNSPVPEPVWQLYGRFLERAGPVPTLIEWDNDLPALDVLLDEQRCARDLLARMTVSDGVPA